LEINLEESSVKVNKQVTDDMEADIRILKARMALPSSSPQITPPETDALGEVENIFDAMF
jgi:hypothetical protein